MWATIAGSTWSKGEHGAVSGGGDSAMGWSGGLSGRGGAALQPVEVTTTPFSLPLASHLLPVLSFLSHSSLSSLAGVGHGASTSHCARSFGRLPSRSAACVQFPTRSGQIRQVLADCAIARPPSSSASWATPQPFPLSRLSSMPLHFLLLRLLAWLPPPL